MVRCDSRLKAAEHQSPRGLRKTRASAASSGLCRGWSHNLQRLSDWDL